MDPVALAEALQAAYDAFHDAAAIRFAGGDAGTAPASGGWSARQVVAHVAVNDAQVAAVSEAVLAGFPDVRFENGPASDDAVLDAFAAECADDDEVLAEGRRRARRVVELTAALTPPLAAGIVHCRLVDGGRVVVDATVPWGRVLEDQARLHLPSHQAQIADQPASRS
jgi:hypothetical protein